MKKIFSPEFYDYIGKSNIFLDEVLSDEQRRCVARSNLETLLSYSCRQMNVSMVSEINFVRSVCQEYFKVVNNSLNFGYYAAGQFPLIGDPRKEYFQWRVSSGPKSFPSLYADGKVGKGFVDLYATIYGKSMADAFRALSEEHGLTENDLFNFFNFKNLVFESDASKIETVLLPKSIICESDLYFFE
ncbi:hypothetical protein [Solidesulfovibrio carbinolicus]|uniref:hypothetical protein n=1 Tax=Solidesulfovibrio carbinolicus TaxID=296842 RepID=UPI001012E044|nr:hypothetical protein [Solidesulfovibrio carbinolicus]